MANEGLVRHQVLLHWPLKWMKRLRNFTVKLALSFVQTFQIKLNQLSVCFIKTITRCHLVTQLARNLSCPSSMTWNTLTESKSLSSHPLPSEQLIICHCRPSKNQLHNRTTRGPSCWMSTLFLLKFFIQWQLKDQRASDRLNFKLFSDC